VLVIDDGSRDGTVAYVEGVAAGHPAVRVIRQVRNQGKGAAVLRGLQAACGRYILFADADGATPIAEADKLLRVAARGVEVVVGSRKAVDQSVQRERSPIRDLMGAVFYRVTNLLAVPGVRDTQCGFKLFRRVAAQRIVPLMRETGWAFDVEVLFLAQKCGLAIVEVPVNWTAIAGSKISPVKDAIKMFMAVLRIRQRGAGLGAIRGVETVLS
jgi:dolichyl-phosphate beta-glucosyltransferase